MINLSVCLSVVCKIINYVGERELQTSVEGNI